MSEIPETVHSGGPFEVGNTLSVYEAAMVYAGRNPGGTFLTGNTKDPAESFGPGSVEEYERYLGRWDAGGDPARILAWDIYCELLRQIEVGQIEPTKRRYLSSGKTDPRDTLISIIHLVKLAKKRGDTPEYLADFMMEVLNTGLPGRPSKSWELIEKEFEARISRGELAEPLKGEVEALLHWLAATYPLMPQPKPNTLGNKIRNRYKEARARNESFGGF